MVQDQRALIDIGISLGGMGSLNDGLGEFATQIGSHIGRHARAWREQRGMRFSFHLREHLAGSFGSDVDYLPMSRWQQWRHVQPRRYALWHSLHQINRTLPPQCTGRRLVTVHDLNYVYKPSRFSVWRDHRRAMALVRRTDHIVAISQYTAADVRKHWAWTGPLDVISSGPRDQLAVAQAPLEGIGARPFLLHISRLAPSKNPQAMLALAAAWPEMDFVFCGPRNAHVTALQASNRLPNVQVRVAISNEQKAWAYAHCAGFLFPSFSEGFGLPPVEAMQFGKPVFLSRLTSLPEVGGNAAYYFDDWAPAAMRAVVEYGLRRGADPARIEQVKQHARRFDCVAAADAYLALYLRLLPPAAHA
jgi:glycosyltransferase involved in cell wall biosynthesis